MGVHSGRPCRTDANRCEASLRPKRPEHTGELIELGLIKAPPRDHAIPVRASVPCGKLRPQLAAPDRRFQIFCGLASHGR